MNKLTRFFKEKALSLILLAVLVVTVLASFLVIRSIILRAAQNLEAAPSQEVNEPWTEESPVDLPVAGNTQGIPVTSPTPSPGPSPSPSPSSGPTGQPTASAVPDASAAPDNAYAPAAASFVWPVTGQLGQAFSGDELVYSETLRDWRTHNGLDILTGQNAPVKACVAGTVSRIYDGGIWGTVLEMNDGALTWRYCGLAGEPAVKEGAVVEAGDLLGTLGTVEAESALAPHLHLEILAGAEYRDPAQFFGE